MGDVLNCSHFLFTQRRRSTDTSAQFPHHLEGHHVDDKVPSKSLPILFASGHFLYLVGSHTKPRFQFYSLFVALVHAGLTSSPASTMRQQASDDTSS